MEQERYKQNDQRNSGDKIFIENDPSVISYECYDYINNSFSAAKESESIDNSGNKENCNPPNSALWRSFLSDISEKDENNSLIFETTPNKIQKEISLSKFTPNKSYENSWGNSEKKENYQQFSSSRKPLSIKDMNSNQKDRMSNEEPIVSIQEQKEILDHTPTLTSINWNSQQKSALFEALAHNNDSYEDTIMMQLNQQLLNRNTIEETEGIKEGFEILEINNGTESPTHKSDSIIPKTPVKSSQSDSKAPHMRKLNFNDEDEFEKEECLELRRRQRHLK